ncbi:M23 family metallopeptidase, partial [Kribbella sancticallisti]|uniref:M23 family metallopeptidase n=1 Tax=Kribbella sancticallisti TaxID=460087 RepID=UPI0031DFBB09
MNPHPTPHRPPHRLFPADFPPAKTLPHALTAATFLTMATATWLSPTHPASATELQAHPASTTELQARPASTTELQARPASTTELQARPAATTELQARPASVTEPPDAVWPLHPRPEVVRGFDLPAKPWLPGHRGVDLAGTTGQQVLSATPGTITYSGTLAGRGVIVVTHGQLRTTYEPVIPQLPVGTPVAPGTPIAHLSAAGTHCPPHPCLHWGLLKATEYQNPLSLLPDHPIRLLPHTTTPDPPTGPTPPSTRPAGPRAIPLGAQPTGPVHATPQPAEPPTIPPAAHPASPPRAAPQPAQPPPARRPAIVTQQPP